MLNNNEFSRSEVLQSEFVSEYQPGSNYGPDMCFDPFPKEPPWKNVSRDSVISSGPEDNRTSTDFDQLFKRNLDSIGGPFQADHLDDSSRNPKVGTNSRIAQQQM